MNELHTSLLREKFVIFDSSPESLLDGESVTALSNRLEIKFRNPRKKDISETYIIRSQNMHSCIRMAAVLTKSYILAGPLMQRPKPFDWDNAWSAVVNDFEYRFNENLWCSIYKDGKIVFQSGEHHMFLDVIEQCAQKNDGEYEKSLSLAEDAFKKAGKVVKIDHQSNVALVMNIEKNEGKFGVILRSPFQTTTFNFSVKTQKKGDTLNIAQCLSGCAAFLDGVQLAYKLGINNYKRYLGIIEKFSTEEKLTREAGKRLGRLNSEIANLERSYDVRYRPEKPDFAKIVTDAEKLAQEIIKPPEDDDEDTPLD